MARPKLKDKEKRKRNVNVALNEIEYEKISMTALNCKKKMATYIREVSLSGNNLKVVPEVNRRFATRLLKMQATLNRLVGHLKQEDLTEEEVATLKDIQNQLRHIHQEFLGYGIN